MKQQHLCGKQLEVGFFVSHGETILDVVDPDTGAQVYDRCPECGEEVNEGVLFPIDIFLEVYAEMAEA